MPPLEAHWAPVWMDLLSVYSLASSDRITMSDATAMSGSCPHAA